MAEPKTRPTDADVGAFIAAVPDDRRRQAAETLRALLTEVTGEPPVMWGDAIVGFGRVQLRYATGRELDWPLVGFSPRKQATTVYLTDGFDGRAELLERLGPHSVGTACLYLKRFDAVDLEVLRELVRRSVAAQRGASTVAGDPTS